MSVTSQSKSLDYVAMATSQKIAEVIGSTVKGRDVEILVTKTLGVLQSQGVYAMALFLFSRSGRKSDTNKMSVEERIATQVIAWLWPLRNPYEALQKLQANGSLLQTDKPPEEVNVSKDEMLKEWADLSNDLDTLLLVRDLYEQTLIYARYGAKAAGGE